MMRFPLSIDTTRVITDYFFSFYKLLYVYFLTSPIELFPETMLLLGEINELYPIHLSLDEMGVNLTVGFLTLISLVMDGIIIVAIVRQRNIPIDSRFILSVSIADALFALMGCVVMISSFAGGIIVPLDRTACLINAIALVYLCSVSIFSLVALTANRYLVIMHEMRLPEGRADLLIVCMWTILLGVVVAFSFALNLDITISLDVTKAYCGMNWTSSDPLAASANVVCIVVIAIPIIFITMAYSRMIYSYSKSHRVIRERGKEFWTPNERKLVIKACAITLGYFLSWTPFLIKIVIEMVKKDSVSKSFSFFAEFAVGVAPMLNAIILLRFDAQVRIEVDKMLPETHITKRAKCWLKSFGSFGSILIASPVPSERALPKTIHFISSRNLNLSDTIELAAPPSNKVLPLFQNPRPQKNDYKTLE